MARAFTPLGTFGLVLLLIGNASAHLIPFSAPTSPGVTFSAVHFRHSASFCTVGAGASRIPTEIVRWLGEPQTANHPIARLRAAMSAHGRFYHGQTYRPDAVYLVQPESLAPKAGDGDLDRRNLGMFVQVIVSLGSDSRFEFELLYDFDSDRLAEALDVIAFVDVDVQEPTTDGAPTPYYAGLNPALPASFGAIQHAMESSQDVLGSPGNGVGYGWGGFPADSGDYFAPDEDYAFNWDLSDLQGGIAQQNLEGSGPGNFDVAPEPGSLAVFCGLGVLALWGAWLRKVKRKPV